MIVPKNMRPPERFKPIMCHNVDGFGGWFRVQGEFRKPKRGEYFWSILYKGIKQANHFCIGRRVIMVRCMAPQGEKGDRA